MKSLFSRLLVTSLALWFTTTSAQAQNNSEERKALPPKWISDKGYWVVESNKKAPKEATVYFYSNDNTLVYKEEVKNQKLKLNKSKTLLRLKAVLEEAVTSYIAGNWTSQNNLLAARLQE